jgi:hypothetical protein
MMSWRPARPGCGGTLSRRAMTWIGSWSDSALSHTCPWSTEPDTRGCARAARSDAPCGSSTAPTTAVVDWRPPDIDQASSAAAAMDVRDTRQGCQRGAGTQLEGLSRPDRQLGRPATWRRRAAVDCPGPPRRPLQEQGELPRPRRSPGRGSGTTLLRRRQGDFICPSPCKCRHLPARRTVVGHGATSAPLNQATSVQLVGRSRDR